MTKKKVSDLEKQIAKRIGFLEKVIAFAISIVSERGRIRSQTVHSCHTHTIRDLFDFGGFCFRTDMGQTETGGNKLAVSFNTCRSHEEMIFVNVLTVYWQDSAKEYEVIHFSKNEWWEQDLLDVITNRKSISEEFDRNLGMEKRKIQRKLNETIRQQSLEEKAKKLMIEI